jgi:hypothetical protein
MDELELTRTEQINAEHHACEESTRVAIKHALRCGALLEEQKREVPHGEWGGWLLEDFGGSARTAQVYMRLNRKREELANAQPSAHLSIDGALKALASGASEKEPEEDEAAPKGAEEDEPPANGTEPDERERKDREKLERKLERLEREDRDYKQALKELKNLRKEQEEWQQRERQRLLREIEPQFVEEIARIKAHYGDEAEPTFAEIPDAAWREAMRNAKDQRVIDVTKHLNELYAWPRWMGKYWPDEAVEAIMDMERKDALVEGWDFIIDWMTMVRDKLDD